MIGYIWLSLPQFLVVGWSTLESLYCWLSITGVGSLVIDYLRAR
jgi:hypothetical protein